MIHTHAISQGFSAAIIILFRTLYGIKARIHDYEVLAKYIVGIFDTCDRGNDITCSDVIIGSLRGRGGGRVGLTFIPHFLREH